MKIIPHFLVAFAIALAGCSPRPTESEFNSLKQADDALLTWIKNVLTSFETGDPVSNGDNVKQIMDGGIIKSDLGKKIRTNMQATLAVAMAATEGTEGLGKAKKAIYTKLAEARLNSTAGRFGAADACIKEAEAMNKKMEGPFEAAAAKLKELQPALVKLSDEREQMFKEMRQALEN